MTKPRFEFNGDIPPAVCELVRRTFASRQLPSWLDEVCVFLFDEPEQGVIASILPKPEYRTAVLRLNEDCFADLSSLERHVHHEIDHLFQGHAIRMVGRLTDTLPDPTNRTVWEAFLIAVEHDRNELEGLRPLTLTVPHEKAVAGMEERPDVR